MEYHVQTLWLLHLNQHILGYYVWKDHYNSFISIPIHALKVDYHNRLIEFRYFIEMPWAVMVIHFILLWYLCYLFALAHNIPLYCAKTTR